MIVPGDGEHLRHLPGRASTRCRFPTSCLEAARIDGASEFRIFRAIVVPALKPIIVTLAVFTLLGTWNDFMWPLIVLTDKDLYTLAGRARQPCRASTCRITS